jgi:hypothetical protein
MLSLIKDLLEGVDTLYLKTIVALSTPADAAVYPEFEKFGLKTGVCAPDFKSTC